MTIRNYMLVSGCIFALVAVLHLVRVAAGWDLIVGGWTAPVWASVLGIVVPAVLALAAFRLAPRD